MCRDENILFVVAHVEAKSDLSIWVVLVLVNKNATVGLILYVYELIVEEINRTAVKFRSRIG